MRSIRTPYAACALLLAVACGLCAWLLLSSSAARAAGASSLQSQISSGQSRISSLSGSVSGAGDELSRLNASVASLKGQIDRIQGALDGDRTQLLSSRAQLTAAQTRLTTLEAAAARDARALAARLVNSYETTTPDIVTVVLESTGFQDLLDRLAFAQRIEDQDVQVISHVKGSRRAVAAQATRIGALEERRQRITESELSQRNALARTRVGLVAQRLQVAQLRQKQVGQLADAKSSVTSLERQLSQAQAAAGVTPSASGSPRGSRSRVSSSGGFVFPLPKSAAAPPSTWSPDQGVDIAAPGNTPEYAVCAGTIVLHGIGGFGPWAPVLHCDAPIDGYGYVYYGHAGPENQLPIGTHVSSGETIGSIGPGIVGISTGPHLEIGFADSSGSPIGDQTAGTMLSLLTAAYNA
jgi:peptidoglycan DL-endopeptidase CwlO